MEIWICVRARAYGYFCSCAVCLFQEKEVAIESSLHCHSEDKTFNKKKIEKLADILNNCFYC